MSLETMISSQNNGFPFFTAESSNTSLSFLGSSSAPPMEDSPKNERTAQKSTSLRSQKKSERNPRHSKVCTQLSKINTSRAPELLEKYYEKNSSYRNEEFTQQACSFIAKIASDEEIPREIKGNCSLYYILVSISKIFMLNEYELTMLACLLDHCKWNIDQIVREDEENFLKEFPCSLEVEIMKESRRLIIYLLLLTFALKTSLNDKEEMEIIQAFCEKICKNFPELLKRSSRAFSSQSFNFPPAEINKKFRFLSKKDNTEPFMKIVKDYNMVVESILRLTGSHTTKPKVKVEHQSPKMNAKNKVDDSHKSHTAESTTDTDIFYADFGNNSENFANMPIDFSRQSSSEKYEDFINCKREADLEIFQEEEEEESKVKKMAKCYDDEVFSFLQQQSEQQEHHSNLLKDESFAVLNNIAKQYEPEDVFGMMNFARNPSSMSMQTQAEIPSFSRFNSNYSLFGTNR